MIFPSLLWSSWISLYLLDYTVLEKDFEEDVPTLCGSVPPRHGISSGCGWRRRPPDVEDSCVYIGINTVLIGSLSP